MNTISSFPHYREILKNLGDNVEGDSDHSDKVTSNEGTAVKRDVNSKADLSSRLRTRPVVKRFIDKKYGTIVGIDSLKNHLLRRVPVQKAPQHTLKVSLSGQPSW